MWADNVDLNSEEICVFTHQHKMHLFVLFQEDTKWGSWVKSFHPDISELRGTIHHEVYDTRKLEKNKSYYFIWLKVKDYYRSLFLQGFSVS